MYRRLPAAILLFYLLALPAAAASAEWLDWDWHYRFSANVSAGAFARTDWIIEERADFSEILGTAAAGKHLDPDSIRVIEHAASGETIGEAVSQFDPDTPGSFAGDLMWLANGTTPSGETRHYYVYFDVLENGAKPAPGYDEGVVVRNRDEDLRIDNSELMVFMDRVHYGYTHVIKKAVDWDEVGDPPPYDPLENSRQTIKEFRGFVSAPEEHTCDPGCEWSQGNLSISVVHEGPLRAAVSTEAINAVTTSGGSRPFNVTTRTYFYSGKNYYRIARVYRFDEYPQDITGLNRRMWIYGYPMYAYAARTGVKEGPFPEGGAEYLDSNGTWDDGYDLGSGIANLELSPLPEPKSIWVEKDTVGGLSYLSSLWRPNRFVSGPVAGNTVYYFHDGDWQQGRVPEKYAELANPPNVTLGNVSSFLLKISAPASILNWNPSLPLEASVEGNRSQATVSCRVRSLDNGALLYQGPVGGQGVSVFGLPNGRISIECIASEQGGNSEYASAETMVYDVITLLEICGAAFLVILLAIAAAVYRLRKGFSKAPKGHACPRCGMPLHKGARSCPVCGKRFSPPKRN